LIPFCRTPIPGLSQDGNFILIGRQGILSDAKNCCFSVVGRFDWLGFIIYILFDASQGFYAPVSIVYEEKERTAFKLLLLGIIGNNFVLHQLNAGLAALSGYRPRFFFVG